MEIDVSLNGKVISTGTDTYPYKAYLEKLLSYKPRTLTTQMKACSLLEKDTAEHMEDPNYAAAELEEIEIDAADLVLSYPAGSGNVGLSKRHKAVDGSKKNILMDRLYIDLFQQDKFLPNGVDLRLIFNRAKSDFYMMTVALSSGKVKIENMLLWVRKIKPSPTV